MRPFNGHTILNDSPDWRCPGCGRVYSGSVDHCPHCDHNQEDGEPEDV